MRMRQLVKPALRHVVFRTRAVILFEPHHVNGLEVERRVRVSVAVGMG